MTFFLSSFRKLCNLRLEYVAGSDVIGRKPFSFHYVIQACRIALGVRWKEACSHKTALYMKLIVNYL